MKKLMKSKSKPAEPAGHPPVLDIKPEGPKVSAPTPERHKSSGRRGQKGGR